MATVKLTQGSAERLIEYTFTNSKGEFTIATDGKKDSLQLSIAMLGYKTYNHPAVSGRKMNIHLSPATISLREVVVKPGRISSRNDTINYNIADFLSSKDESVKDIIKKLPGLDVDAGGKISYNGKNISKFYVEGMDLTGGKYNQINNNLRAKAVNAVQVLENHQPVRMLKDKISADDIAINLKLKPEFRDKWMVNLYGGTGYSPDNPNGELLWEADVNALQLSRKSQSSYAYKTNNIGHDITNENKTLTDGAAGRIKSTVVPSFVSQPSLVAPLKTERWLFNDMHTASANRLYKMGETTQLRLNAGYTHDVRNQQRGSETTYYQPGDTVSISEQSDTRINSDLVEVGVNLEKNADSYFLTNRFSSTGLWEEGVSQFTGLQSFEQRIDNVKLGVKNEFRTLWNKKNHTLETGSLLQFDHAPSTLRAEGVIDRQRINLNLFYTDNYFSVLRKKGDFTHSNKGGIKAQGSNIQNSYGAYLTPMWQLNSSQLKGTFTLPFVWNKYPGKDFSRLAVNPSVNLQYKLNYAWLFTLYGSLQESYSSLADCYNTPYYIDYRHIYMHRGEPTINRQQLYFLYGEYKNTVREFFTTLSVTYSRNRANSIYEQLIEEDRVILATRAQTTHSTGWTVNGNISKGIFDWKLKASMKYTLVYQKAEQISQGERMPFKSTFMQYEPTLSWSPVDPMEIKYESSFRYGGSKIGNHTKLTPLWNIVQKLNLSYNFSHLELGVAADHYYNDVSNEKGIHAFLVDASLRWNSGRWQVDCVASNLLDKRQYAYTRYSSLQSYSSWVNIRGREFRIGARYRW